MLQLQKHSFISRKLIFTVSFTQICIVVKFNFYINSMNKFLGEKGGSIGRFTEFYLLCLAYIQVPMVGIKKHL